jgi:hypothetical protein
MSQHSPAGEQRPIGQWMQPLPEQVMPSTSADNVPLANKQIQTLTGLIAKSSNNGEGPEKIKFEP